jgi:hypothetical protein
VRWGGDGEHRRAGVRTSPSAGAGSVCRSILGHRNSTNLAPSIDRSRGKIDRGQSL